jgi:predicted O-methyltransferase YrrM
VRVRVFVSFVAFVFLVGFVSFVGAQTPELRTLLADIKRGRFLRVMIASSGAKRVLEIGGAHGYSAIWMGMGLRETGGRVTTIDKRFLDLMLPRLAPRGLFVAHNVVNTQSDMRDFLDAIKNDPRLFTTIVTPSSEGMSISVKIK